MIEKALEASGSVLPTQFWLKWLGQLLSTVNVDDEIAADLLSELEGIYNEAKPESRTDLALDIALPLAYLPVTEQTWVPSVIHNAFYQEIPYIRSYALDGITSFAPLVLALGDLAIVTKTWDKIQVVEQLSDRRLAGKRKGC